MKTMTNDGVTMEIGKLENCPFCDGEARIHTVGNSHTKKRSAVVGCSTMGCTVEIRVGAIHQGLEWCVEKAVEQWNTRHPNPIGSNSAHQNRR